MLLKIRSFIKKLNQLVLVGLIASFAWAGVATFIYFNELINHTKYNGRPIRDYFSWKIHTSPLRGSATKIYINFDDADRARDKMDKIYNENQNQQGKKWTIHSPYPSPVFNLIGYLFFVLMPIAIGWLFAWFIMLLHSRDTFFKVWHGFNSSDLVIKSAIIGAASYLFLLWNNEGDIPSSVSYLIYIYIIAPIIILGLYYLSLGIWLCIKKIVYGIFYAANKAINDARLQK